MPRAAPTRAIAYAAPRIACEQASDGSLRLRSTELLAPHDPSLARLFRAAVERNPGGLFLAERGADGAWRKVTYDAARRAVDALAHSLIERGLSAERPVMILSGNGIDHALLTLAGHTAGIPVAPDLGRLFAAEPGSHQAQAHRRFARAWPALRRRHRSFRQGARRARPRQYRAGREPQRREFSTPSRHSTTWRGAARGQQWRKRRRRPAPIPSPRSCSRPARPACPRAVVNTHGMLCREPAAARADLAVPRRGAARACRLAAVEPHLRRQPQLQPGAAPRRHAVHRRRPAAARSHRGDGHATSARSRPRSTSTCRRAMRRCCRSSSATTRCARAFFARAAPDLLRRAPRCRRTCGSGSKPCRCAQPASACR